MEEGININNKNWIPTKKFFSDALLIALLTGVGYISAFAYQYSYLHYFGIPIYFIDINLVTILLTASVGLVFLLGVIWIFDFSLSLDRKSKFTKALLIFVGICLIGFPIIWFVLNQNSILLSIVMFLLLILLLIGLLIGDKHPKKNERVKNNYFLDKIEELYGSFPLLFILALIYFTSCCYVMGGLIAQNQTDYLVSSTNPELAIITTYAGNFIGVTFNSTKKTFDKNITLISQDKISNNNIMFSKKEIGPLKPVIE